MRPASAAGETEQLITFGLAGERYGLPVGFVAGVASGAGLRRMEGLPEGFRGAVSSREGSVAVMDLGERLGLGRRRAGEGKMLISHAPGGAPLGLLVDEVHGVREVREDALESLPLYFDRAAEHLRGIARLPDGLTLVLDPVRLLSSESRGALEAWRQGADEPADGASDGA